jgi:acetolactate synthase-1/2/3 large subunit
MTGGDLLIECLKAQGVRCIFGMPGTQNIHIYDSLYRCGEGIQHVLFRNELAATLMADGYARASGDVGVALTVPGPGAANAAGGMEEAMCDCVPVLLLTGQASTDQLRRRHPSKMFHGLDHQQVFASVAKYCGIAMSVAEVPQVVSAAFEAMRNGRPGPTVLDFPMDVVMAEAAARVPPRAERQRAAPDGSALTKAIDAIRQAQRPLLLAGSAVTAADAMPELQALAELLNVPVAVTRRGKGVIPEDHPLALSNLNGFMGKEAWNAADALISVGVRFTSIDSRGWSLELPHPHVQIDPEASEIGREYPADVGVVGDLKRTLQQLAAELKAARVAPKHDWTERLANFRRDAAQRPQPPLLPEMREALNRDAIVSVDVHSIGYRTFAEFPCYDPHTFLYPCIGVDLGYAFPAALGAKVAHPDKQVVCFTGDGGFLYAATELATAVMYGINVVTIVINDQCLTAIRGVQERMCEGRYIDTDLYNPDFVQFAESFGAVGLCVERFDDFKPALVKALSLDKPSVIEVQAFNMREELMSAIPWLASRIRV